MASENSMNGGESFHVKKLGPDGQRGQTADGEPLCSPSETGLQYVDRHGRRAPSLSQCSATVFCKDSGISSMDPSPFPKNHDMCRPDTCEADILGEDPNCTNGFSEEHLLNITFEACDPMGKGEVLASTIMQYLQDMTAQSPDQEKLTALHDMLDPDHKDCIVDRDTFHSTMRTWIAQCSQNGLHEDYYQTSGADLTKVPINGIDFSPPETETEFPEGGDGHYCEWKDLLSTIAELKHTRRRLSEQNSSLLRSLSQCEDANLQLTLEVAELRTKLASAQRSAVRARTLSEELDESRRVLRESQERASRAQASGCKLIKESECLKAHIKLIEDANEKLSHERTSAEGRINKLMRMNGEIREELDETLVLLAEKDSEITKKTKFIEELRISRLGNLKIFEGMQSELLRLQENSRQELLRFDRFSVNPQSSLGRCDRVPHAHSLQSEIQETQKCGNTDGVGSPICGILPQHGQRDDFQRILPQIKSLELIQLFHTQPAETDALAGSVVDVLERAYLQCQQQQASTKQQLANVERELELQMVLREEVEGRLEERERLLAEAHKQTQEAKKAAAINWWRALKVEEDKTKAREEASQAGQARAKTEDRLQRAEATIQELRDQVRHLEAALRTAQQQVEEFRNREEREAAFSKADDSCPSAEGQGCPEAEERKQRKDAAVATDPVEEVSGSVTEAGVSRDSCDSAADTVLEAWRRVERMVSRASEAADLLAMSQQRLSQAKERMEATAKRVEEALSRATDAETQLIEVKVGISARTEPTGLSWSTDLGSVGEASTEPSSTDTPRSPSELEPVNQTCLDPPCHPVNGGITSPGAEGGDSRTRDSNSFGAASLTDTPVQVQHLPCGVDSQANSSEDGFARPPLLDPAKALRRQPETDTLCCVPPSHGPGPEERHSPASEDDRESRTRDHVGGSGVPAHSDSCQSEPADYGRRQACVTQTQTPTDSVQTGEDQTSECGALREPDSPPETSAATATATTTSTNPHSPTRGTQRRPRTRPPLTPAMPTLPEEEEDSPEELDSSSSSPITCTPVENKVVTMPLPTPSIVFPRQDNPGSQDPSPLELARPLSPRPRLSRNSPSSGGPITTVDSTGHVIDLVKDQLPDLQLSAEDKRKNLELLEEAKKVSDRFLTRRGRRSTCSLSESPTAGPSPNLTPHSSPVPSRSSSLTVPPQTAPEEPGVNYVNPPASQLLEVHAVGEQEDTGPLDQESLRKLVDWKPKEKRKVSSGTLAPRHAAPGTAGQGSVEQKENSDPRLGSERGRKGPGAGEEEGPGRGGPRRGPDDEAPATGVAKPVPRSGSQQVPCTAEIKTIGAFPPLMRAVSWDTVSSFPARNGAQDSSPKNEEALSFFDKSSDSLFKSSGYKDFPVQPVKMQKLAKMREEHKLIRNQSIVGSKLPDLSETAEQERGPSPCPPLASATEEEAKEKSDVMPNISDVMLRKLKLHRALPGSAPPLTEKEVENTFVQLSLAFRNDSYTLETRLRQAERERNLTEENTEKELEEFKGCLKGSASLWQTSEQRESYQRLVETVAILHRLATRLSSRAEMVGAVRQEKRMNKATEVMMQYVENLKRTYEKDHAELMEFKKLANQNSNRCYGGSIDTGDDGVPRTSRSLSLTLGKALPRRRVSVAVVPKFNLLNIPGQTPQTAPSPPLPVLCEANNSKCGPPTEPTQQAVTDGVKAPADQEAEASAPAKLPSNPGEISSEMKAKIEEDAYKKGYQEGLKRSKELQELKEEEEKAEESQEEIEEKECKEAKEKKCSSKYEKVLDVLDRLCPKIFRQNRLFWIVLTLFVVTFFVVSVFAYFSDRHSELGDVSAGKTMGPGKKKFFGWNVRFQPKNPTTE